MEELVGFNETISENTVYPNYFYAGFWIRCFSFIVDLICISVIITSTIGVMYKIQGLETSNSLMTIYGIVSLIVYLSYFTLLTKWNNGQTLGKMIFGIKVISFDEEELSWQTVLIRECVCRFILKTFIFGVGYLVTVLNPKKQHVGDYFSDTGVVIINMVKASNNEVK